MATGKLTFNPEWGKVAGAIFMAATFIYYAGKFDQKVTDMDKRLEKIENRLEVYHFQQPKPLGQNTLFTSGIHMEACLLNDEERL
jgi:hypothetical protein